MTEHEHEQVPPAPPGDDEDEAIVEDGSEGHARPIRNDYEEFVKGLPEGFAVCPMCLAVGAVVEDPPFDPRTHVCYTCLGHGAVRTGSIVTGHVTQTCSDCEGKGYVWNDPGEAISSPANAADLAGDVPPVDYKGRTPDDPEFDWSRIMRAGDTPAAEPEPALQ